MRQKLLFVFCLLAMACVPAFSQRRSVTNTDLESYRQQRLRAEREYRENYVRLGFPSPEELARQRDESVRESVELSNRLRAERLQRESIEAAQMALARQAMSYPDYPQGFGGNTIYGAAWFDSFSGGRRHRHGGFGRFPGFGRFGQSGYFAGGNFWPTPVRFSRPMPLIRSVSPPTHR